jgi:adenylosuccinate lyase
MATVVEGLVINPAAIRRNLAFLHGINMAESVMIELTRKGMGRQDAHERIRVASMQALAAERPLADVLAGEPEVTRFIPKAEIAALLSPDAYIGTAVQQVERVIAKLSPLAR